MQNPTIDSQLIAAGMCRELATRRIK